MGIYDEAARYAAEAEPSTFVRCILARAVAGDGGGYRVTSAMVHLTGTVPSAERPPV